ncbi:MAG: 16S rRNA (cytidine(1402)-2'-O)-methyltransferase [Bacteroidota bacterium]|nr:16S rRNA (cytidine(1402)-2'-O)-methyltransferase [Bacteroidota bacterium]
MPKIYVIPTPIGNLKDITLRAIETLNKVKLVYAEDTRKTKVILKKYNIKKKILSFHIYNENKNAPKIIENLKEDDEIALVSDAGTPLISDPGFSLINIALKKKIEVECLPGPTSFVPAVVVSGLPTHRFIFEGFLPHKKGRKKRIIELKNETRTTIFFESPHRLIKTLSEFNHELSPNRKISISRELTKIHEETFRGSISGAIKYFDKKKIRGEFIICISGHNE